jgi:hypothetical protein
VSKTKKIVIDENDFEIKQQFDFITDSSTPFLLLLGGYGSGKTHCFRLKTALNLLNKKGYNGKSNGMIIYPTRNLGYDNFTIPFCELLEEWGIEYNYNDSKKRISTHYGDISIFHMQKPENIVGTAYTYIGIDEFDVGNYRLCNLVWNRAIGRARGKESVQVYLVTTPEGFKKTYELFGTPEALADPEKRTIRVKSTDNPYLPESYLRMMRSTYDAKLLQQYMNAEYVNLNSSTVYYNFDRDIHCKEFNELMPRSIFVGMDFNIDPMTCVIARKQGDHLFIFDEIYINNRSNTREMAKRLRSKYLNNEIHIYPDATGKDGTSNASPGQTDISILREAEFGFQVHARSSNYDNVDAYNTVNSRLINGMGLVNILVDPKCTKLIEDWEQCTYLENVRKIDTRNPKRTHISDAAKYLITGIYGINVYNPSVFKAEQSHYSKVMQSVKK